MPLTSQFPNNCPQKFFSFRGTEFVDVVHREDVSTIVVLNAAISRPVERILNSHIAARLCLTHCLAPRIRALKREIVCETPLERRLQRMICGRQAGVELCDAAVSGEGAQQVAVEPRVFSRGIEVVPGGGASEYGRIRSIQTSQFVPRVPT